VLTEICHLIQADSVEKKLARRQAFMVVSPIISEKGKSHDTRKNPPSRKYMEMQPLRQHHRSKHPSANLPRLREKMRVSECNLLFAGLRLYRNGQKAQINPCEKQPKGVFKNGFPSNKTQNKQNHL